MKKYSIVKYLTTILWVTILLSSCKNENGDWEKAKNSNTLSDYKSFLHKYKNGEYKNIATSIIDSLEWEIAIKGDSLESYQTYLKMNPFSKYAKVARLYIEEFNLPSNEPGYSQKVKEFAMVNLYSGMNEDSVYLEVTKSGMHYKYVAFLEMYPESKYINEIKEKCTQFRILTLSEDRFNISKMDKIFVSTDDLKCKYGFNGEMKLYKWGDGLSGITIGNDGNRIFYGQVCFGNIQLITGEFSPIIMDGIKGYLFNKGSKILYPVINNKN